MRILVITPAIEAQSSVGSYNLQDAGLARALAALEHEVRALRAVAHSAERKEFELGPRCALHLVPCKSLGKHGFMPLSELEAFQPDAVLVFTDLMLCVPSLAHWSRSHGIPMAAYVGTMRSTKSRNRWLEAFSRARNLRVLKGISTFAKTQKMADELTAWGVRDVRVASVGLDLSDLPAPSDSQRQEARDAFGVQAGKVLGFVGRLDHYKEPLLLPEILAALRKHDESWQLALVGDGPLADVLRGAFREKGPDPCVHWKQSLPNNEMWKLYRCADVLVNLNRNEIFGMSLLESMFYGTPVVAVRAPGPEIIIRNGTDGVLVGAELDELTTGIELAWQDRAILGQEAHQRVMNDFTWTRSAELIASALSSRSGPGSS